MNKDSDCWERQRGTPQQLEAKPALSMICCKKGKVCANEKSSCFEYPGKKLISGHPSHFKLHEVPPIVNNSSTPRLQLCEPIHVEITR